MAAEGESALSFAGDVIVDHVTIYTSKGQGQNVTSQVLGIELYEDVFSPFISGKILFNDAQDLTNFFPLVGEEVVQIVFRTPALSDKFAYSGEYYIYKIDNRYRLSEREVVFAVHFISKEAIVDLNKKTSRTYSGPVSDIVTKILKESDGLETGKPITVEDTPNTTKFISNFWSPIRSLNYLAESAVNQNGSPSYVFFENKNGFNFFSLESLYHLNPVYQTFVWDNYSSDISIGGSDRNILKDYQRVIDLRTPEMFDYMDRVSSGFYGSQMVHYDITTKKVTHTGYTPKWEDDKHLNEYPLWSDSAVSRSRAVLVHEHKYLNNFNGFGDVTNTKTLQRRLHLMAAARQSMVELTVFGRSDYSAGQKISLNVPMNAQLKETLPAQEFQDDILSGTYLVTACCHLVMRNRHECVIEAVKDSYIVDLNKE